MVLLDRIVHQDSSVIIQAMEQENTMDQNQMAMGITCLLMAEVNPLVTRNIVEIGNHSLEILKPRHILFPNVKFVSRDDIMHLIAGKDPLVLVLLAKLWSVKFVEKRDTML